MRINDLAASPSAFSSNNDNANSTSCKTTYPYDSRSTTTNTHPRIHQHYVMRDEMACSWTGRGHVDLGNSL